MTNNCEQCGTKKPKYIFECPRCGAHPSVEPTPKLLFDVSVSLHHDPTSSQNRYTVSSAQSEGPKMLASPLWVDYESIKPSPDGPPTQDIKDSALPDRRQELVLISSFWPIVSVLFIESIFVYMINVGLAIVVSEVLLIPTEDLYDEKVRWMMYALHFICSWAVLLAPLLFFDKTPFMSSYRLSMPFKNNGQRMFFSLLYLLSLVLLPITVLFILTDRNHRTPSEALLGLPILQSN